MSHQALSTPSSPLTREALDPAVPGPGVPPPLSWWQRFAFSLICLAALVFRIWGIGEKPKIHYTADEFHYVWAGLSLLHEGRPTSWSWLPGHKTLQGSVLKVISPGGYPYQIVRPALDHPPLFSLLAGAFAELTGPRAVTMTSDAGKPFTFWEVDLGQVRYLSVFLFVLTFHLLFTLVREGYSANAALLTILIYGLDGNIAVRNRLLVTETLLTPLLLANLLYLARYLGGRVSRRGFAWACILTGAAAVLAKLSGSVQAGIVIVMLLLAGRRREILYPLIGVALGLGLYLAYGAWQGWDAFRTILGSQSGRFDGFNLLTYMLNVTRHGDWSNLDMLLAAGWAAVFVLLVRGRDAALLVTPPLYVLGYGFFCCLAAIHDWHLLPAYPLLCLATALLIRDAWRDCDFGSFLVLFLFFMPYVCHLAYRAGAGRLLGRSIYVGLLALIPAALLLAPRHRRWVVRPFLIAALLAIFAFEFVYLFSPLDIMLYNNAH